VRGGSRKDTLRLMNETVPIELAVLEVSDEYDVFRVRHRTREIARLAGLEEYEQVHLATAVCELSRELITSRITVSITFTLCCGPVPALLVTAEWRPPVIAGPSGPNHQRPVEALGAAPWLPVSGPLDDSHGMRRFTLTNELRPRGDASVGTLPERIREAFLRSEPAGPLEALASQNHDLLNTLGALRARQNELRRASRELEETNRGVVALYAELDAAASRLRDTAHILQRAMLSEPPSVEGLEICVRYRPAGAGDGAEAGGDWHDVFRLPDGDLAVVVGDVVGHDTKAAAAMGQLRAMLHGLAYHNSDQPKHTLEALDRTIRNMRLTPFATCIYTRLHLSEAVDHSSGLVMSWANAGHPGMIVVRPDGTSAVIESPRDIALGVIDAHPRTAGRRWLPPGSLILWFSDGLFERRDECPDASMARLLGLTTLNGRRPLPELCDALVDSAPVEDDLVLVALRLATG